MGGHVVIKLIELIWKDIKIMVKQDAASKNIQSGIQTKTIALLTNRIWVIALPHKGD